MFTRTSPAARSTSPAAMTPEDQRVARKFMHTPELRSGLGGMTPTTFATGYLYAGMGFTTVNEAAVPVLSARHTHEEMADIPIVDKSSLTLMANNEMMLDQLETGEYERAKSVVGVVSVGGQVVRHQGGQSGRRRGVEVGEERESAASPIEGYKSMTPGADRDAARADLRRSRIAASDASALQQPRRAWQHFHDARHAEAS